MYGVVEFAGADVGVAECDVARERVAPGLDFGEKRGVDLGGASFAFLGLGVLVEGAFEDGVAGEGGREVVPVAGIFGAIEVSDAAGAGFVGWSGLDPAVVHGELFEVGEDTEGELGGPCIASELVCGADIVLDGYGGFLGLDEEFACAADSEAVVGGFGGTAAGDSVFMDDVFVGFGVALLVVHVPSEGDEEGINELVADLGFVVPAGVVGVTVAVESLNEVNNSSRYRHGAVPSLKSRQWGQFTMAGGGRARGKSEKSEKGKKVRRVRKGEG